MKKLMFTLTACLCLLACTNENEDIITSDPPVVKYEENYNLKKSFSIALAKSLSNEVAVRELIKEEALKKFNHDYDVLYQLVKDKQLANGYTLREVLLSYLDENELIAIENEFPTLTIFVPELPEDSFSAEVWDVNTHVPVVAIRSTVMNNVPIIDADGKETILEGKYTPAFPVVVIKENERVVVNNDKICSTSLKSLRSESGSSLEFRFLDECFDGQIEQKELRSITSRSAKVGAAFDIYSNTDGWQRDYIYYDIEPDQPDGPFNYSHKEHLVYFSMNGDPVGCYNKIADQTGDPMLNEIAPIYGPVWTDGEFEFKVKVYLGAASPVGSELITFFRAKPDQLFQIESEKFGIGNVHMFLRSKITGLKSMRPDIPLFSWDLEQYGSSIKIGIEEVDNTESTVTTESRAIEYAGNFSFDIGWGEKVKKGMKFGASAKVTRTTTTQKTITMGNDDLGEVIINFADKVATSKPIPTLGLYGLQTYSTGWYKINIEPWKVQ